jgi:hypothetical protein
MTHFLGKEHKFRSISRDKSGELVAQFKNTATGIRESFSRAEIEDEMPSAAPRQRAMLKNIGAVMDCMADLREAKTQYDAITELAPEAEGAASDHLFAVSTDLMVAWKSLRRTVHAAEKKERVPILGVAPAFE